VCSTCPFRWSPPKVFIPLGPALVRPVNMESPLAIPLMILMTTRSQEIGIKVEIGLIIRNRH